jgi:transcriptional regulator with XRE-family HTH domain
MGYRGKLEEQARARQLRAQAWTLQEIADELGVSKGSVSIWVRDVEFEAEPRPRRRGRRARQQRTSVLQQRKLREIEELLEEGRRRIGLLSERDFLVAGVALYAAEGAKSDGDLKFANSDPRFIYFYCRWLRHFFEIDESRLRLRLYLHQGLDLDAANEYWSRITAIPIAQFSKPYRAEPDPSIRNAKHPSGCPAVRYSSAVLHRTVMGLVHALLAPAALGDDVSFDPNGCRVASLTDLV